MDAPGGQAERGCGPCCEQCGYSLRGLGGRAGRALCPECGTAFDASAPWTPRPWPTATRLALALSGPAVAVVLALLAVSTVRSVRAWLVWPFWLIWVLALLFVTIVYPFAAARELAAARRPRVEREKAARAAYVPAMLVNAGVVGAGLVAFFMLLRWR